jgi:hypothetical protein
MSFESELGFAEVIVREAAKLALEYRGRGVSAENKDDD